jgi:hypothetical protein
MGQAPAEQFGSTEGPSPGDIPYQVDVTAASSTSEPDTPPGRSSWTHHLLTLISQALVFLKALDNLT